MSGARGAVGGRPVADDLGEPGELGEYLIVEGADEASLGEVVRAVASLADEGLVRVRDLVLLVRDDDGDVVVRRREELVPGMGRVLSEHDVTLAATAVRPGSAAIVLVVEDLWAAPLAAAARRAGGGIVAGERLTSRSADGDHAASGHETDLLARPPCGAHPPAHGWAELLVDPVEQLKELADLRCRGLLSDDEIERVKARLLPRHEDPQGTR